MPITTTNQSIEDTWLRIGTPNTNFSTNVQILVSALTINGLWKCVPSRMVPPGSTITSAILKMRVIQSSGGPTTISLHECTRNDAEPSQATWNDYITATPWTAGGGDYNPVAMASWLMVGTPNTSTFDLSTEFIAHYNAGTIFTIIGLADTGAVRFDSMEAGPSLQPVFDITYTPPSDTITFNDSLSKQITKNVSDNLIFNEKAKYLSEYLAGVLARITVILDVTKDDFCEIVLEGGQTISLNGVLERAFVFIKQRGQKFDHGIETIPGDAVMFSCPDTPVIAVGDTVIFDNQTFIIADTINHYFDGNLVYVKSALQKKRFDPDMPQVTGLIASSNLKGKTTLTWDDLLPDFPLDHYEIWESLTALPTKDNITALTPTPGIPETEIITDGAHSGGKYVAGQLFSIEVSTDNNGDYILVTYANSGGFDSLTITNLLDDSTIDGRIVNLLNYYFRETTKSNSITLKNLIPNTKYYYMVRAVDKHGNKGQWSSEAVTPIDDVPPAPPTGMR